MSLRFTPPTDAECLDKVYYPRPAPSPSTRRLQVTLCSRPHAAAASRRMRMALPLSLSVCNYDRTAALFDGRVPIEGCDVAAVALVPEESFHRAFKYQEFDVTEVSMSSYLLTTARGDAHYVAIPAFVSRLFRHSGIYIRTDRGIKRPQDLKGKTIGLPEYQMTANVWVRGMLQEEYGVKPRRHQMAQRRARRGRPRRAHQDHAAAGDRAAGDPEGPHAHRHAGEGRDRRAVQRARAVLLPATARRTWRGCSRTIRRSRRPISRRPSCSRSCTPSASASRWWRSIRGSRSASTRRS